MISENLEPSILENELLRSINIEFDAEHPERISHYFPTTKSVQLLNSLFNDSKAKNCFIVAPYGSGKSLLGSFYMHVIENNPISNNVLEPVFSRLRSVDKNCSNFIAKRIKDKTKGITIPLSGYVKELPIAIFNGVLKSFSRLGEHDIANALKQNPISTLEELINFLSLMRDNYGSKLIDHIDIIWDEFGRHIEEIISQGDAQRLNELQLLSEFSVRSKKISMSILLFLHQSLMRYAYNIPRAISDEWKKIEGRFETIQFVDDSKEITLLASRVLASLFPGQKPTQEIKKEMMNDLENSGLFDELSKPEKLQLIDDAYPLIPVALHILPRISSRVAQNERTMFSFLFSLEAQSVISVTEVYDYFSDLMRSDTTLGGTFHHWLETENALSKADTSVEERLIKTLSLLSLGFSGERNRVSKRSLIILAKNYIEDSTIEIELNSLIERKLILHRENSNSVMLWHANDIDLRGRIDSEKANVFQSFNLVEYINEYLPLGGWRPLEYNIDKNMVRFFRGLAISIQELKTFTKDPSLLTENSADGTILYIIPENENELEEAYEILKMNLLDMQIISLLPVKTENLKNLALEAYSIERLLEDTSLIAEDPLIAPELKLMLDDTQTYLMHLIDKLYLPSLNGPRVITNGKEVKNIHSNQDFRLLLSNNMYKLYPDTPSFNNELINKRKPSRVIVNARKKFILGIMERYGTSDIGLDGNRPDKLMFETLIKQNGLYKEQQTGFWSFVNAKEIEDDLLRKFWETLESFFSNPSPTPKSFATLFDELKSPPLGIREGLYPIFLAIGFRAFPAAMVITDPNGEFIQDIKPSTIEEIYKKPEQYHITVVKLSKDQREFLMEFETIFEYSYNDTGLETDPIRRCYDALEIWKTKLPPAAFYSRKFSKPVLLFQKLITRTLNPAKLFLQDFFNSYGLKEKEWPKLVEEIKKWKTELEEIVNQYYSSASNTILATLQIENEDSIRDAGKKWLNILPKNLQSSLNNDLSRALIERFSFPYDTDNNLLDSLSSLLIGKRIDRWDDSTITLFDREFKNQILRIEDEALSNLSDNNRDTGVAIDLLCARIDNLFRKLEEIVGQDNAIEKISELIGIE
jgi:hypothetical protein